MEEQSLEAKKGEIEFRRKLVRQEISKVKIVDDEYTPEEIERILQERSIKTHSQMIKLQSKGIKLNPYIEVGAERCQRSLVMENEVGVSGAAVDLSFDMLKSGDHYGEIFKWNKMPERICCDANTLPFMSGSIPFVFCYETLHHFPSPVPIVKEFFRVLSQGGHFFFEEEPFKRVVHLNLYKSKKNWSKERRNRNIVIKVLDAIFGEMTCNEVEHGIIENHTIPLSEWRETVLPFESKDVKLNALNRFESNLFSPRKFVRYILAYLLGGTISGLCRKKGELPSSFSSILDIVVCPSCIETGFEIKLTHEKDLFICQKCRNKYHVVDGVIMLLIPSKFKELYPELYASIHTD